MGPVTNNGAPPAENGTGKIRRQLEKPLAPWVAIALTVIAGLAGVTASWYSSKERTSLLEAQARSEREARKSQANQFERDLSSLRASLRERIEESRASNGADLRRVAEQISANGAKLERCLELLAQRGPDLVRLKELPARVRSLENKVVVIESRLNSARPGQGIPPAPK